jgi:hypothetical protein
LNSGTWNLTLGIWNHTWSLESGLRPRFTSRNLAHLEYLELHRGISPEVWNHVGMTSYLLWGPETGITPGTWSPTPGIWNVKTRNLELVRVIQYQLLGEDQGRHLELFYRHPVTATGGGPGSAPGISLTSEPLARPRTNATGLRCQHILQA